MRRLRFWSVQARQTRRISSTFSADVPDRTPLLDRVAVLKRVVEAAGGNLVDLHSVVPADEFIDKGGHYTPAGASHLTRILAPIVRAQVRPSVQPGSTLP